MDTISLSLKEFKTWLETKNKDEVFGVTGSFEKCPIANALIETNYKGMGKIVVANYETEVGSKTIRNPLWIANFIISVDELAHCREIDVTAEQTLIVLNNFDVCTTCNKSNPEGTACSKENCPW